MLLRLLAYLVARPAHAVKVRWARSWFEIGRRKDRAGDVEGARTAFERALTFLPERRDWWVALGDARFRQGDFEKALVCYRTAVEPDATAGVHLRLARGLLATGEVFDAISALRTACERDPRSDEAVRELVHALLRSDNVRKAIQVAQERVDADPASFSARLLLAVAYQKAPQPAEALRHYDEALRLRPGDHEAQDMRGVTFQQLGRMEEALADYERALAIAPDYPPAHFHRGLARLLLGEFEKGWDGYELRKLSEDGKLQPKRAPEWDGTPLPGGTLLVRREQGLGDEIMFASMFEEVGARTGKCLIECEARLRALFARSFPQATFFAALPGGALPSRLDSQSIDREIDAGSLPKLLRRSVSAFPSHRGYLTADPSRVAAWKGRLGATGVGPKIGISWTGGVRKTGRNLRSLALHAWLPLLRTPGARFVSLQYTPEAEKEVERFRTGHGVALHHWPEAIADYDETAALACALDLVISVCTSVVHLCGALNRPTWVLAPYSPEWRYGFRGRVMPWYPSVRVFRQVRFGDWTDVLAEVGDELRRFIEAPVTAG